MMPFEKYRPSKEEVEKAEEMGRETLVENYKKEQEERINGLLKEKKMTGHLEYSEEEEKDYPDEDDLNLVIEVRTRKIEGNLDGHRIDIEVSQESGPFDDSKDKTYTIASIDGKLLSFENAIKLFDELHELSFDNSERAIENYIDSQQGQREEEYEKNKKEQEKEESNVIAKELLEKLGSD